MIFFDRYVSKTHQVQVTSGAATVLNFSLSVPAYMKWSKKYDFGIVKNMFAESYLLLPQIRKELQDLTAVNNDIMTYNEIQDVPSEPILMEVHLTARKKTPVSQLKHHVALIANINGDEPVTVEILIRLIRHLLVGKRLEQIQYQRSVFLLWGGFSFYNLNNLTGFKNMMVEMTISSSLIPVY